MLEVNDVLTVKNNENYLVVYTKILEDKEYAFLINTDNYSSNMFCEYDKSSSFVEIKDVEVIEKLLACFKVDKGL